MQGKKRKKVHLFLAFVLQRLGAEKKKEKGAPFFGIRFAAAWCREKKKKVHLFLAFVLQWLGDPTYTFLRF